MQSISLTIPRAELLATLRTLVAIRRKRGVRVVPVWLRFNAKAATLAISEARSSATAIVPASGSWPPAGATVNLFTLRSVVETTASETIELIAVEDAIRIATRSGHVLLHLLPFGPSSNREPKRATNAKKIGGSRKRIVSNPEQALLDFEKVNQTTASESLHRLFQEAGEGSFAGAKDDLAHRHMLALAEMFDSWVFDKRFSPVQTANLLGWAESLRRLAREVGPNWDPPVPKRVSLIAYMGRMILGEETGLPKR